MEKFFDNIHTAQDLFEALNDIPEAIRKDLPLQIDPDYNYDEVSAFDVVAYEVRETEGCLERGFRLTPSDV